MVDTTAPVHDFEPVDAWDPGTPPELVPTMGTHPNQRAYYQTILLDRFIEPLPPRSAIAGEREFSASHGLAAWLLAEVTSTQNAIEAAGQVDISQSLLSSAGFDRVAVGAVLQFSQSWFTYGLALGQLLHSLALAPGESTRIALVDWERRERGERTEGTRETDRLTSQQLHTRALNEVVDAVATELQTGSSAAQSSGESWGFGKSGGGGGSIGGDGQSYGFGGGYSLGYGTGKSQASSWAVSTGERDLRSELSQNIADLTQQASTMARERWSTVVQEVSQEEHERLSTRAVTNYNHMHALTMQYYEVVQLYRVAIELNRVTRCLFVPMKVLDFRRREFVSRFRGAIEAAALMPTVRRAYLADSDTVVLTPGSRATAWDMSQVATEHGEDAWTPGAPELAIPVPAWKGIWVGSNDQGQPFRWLVVERLDGTEVLKPFVLGDRDSLPPTELGLWDYAGVSGTPFSFDTPLAEIRRLSLRRGTDQTGFAGTVTMSLLGFVRVEGTEGAPGGWRYPGGTITLEVEAGNDDLTLADVAVGADYGELIDHLRDNALHYSQAIWNSLDPAAISLALAQFTLGGRPLMEAIDPTPVAVAGNYLVFRTYATDDTWQKFLDDKQLQIGSVSESIVPLPSGGVFAEAVLGRANSAEKLDNSRFWNWQDSPIPIVASEIAALSAGTRNEAPDLTAQPLSPTVLNIMNPTPLPDPTGMTAALNAIAQGTMFRDMSGLAGTIGLAGTALQEAFGGSEAAQRWAAENFKTAASLIGKAGGKPETISEQGAKANQGKDMDRRQQQDPGSVGPNEQKEYDKTVPTGSDPGEWAPWPGDEREFEPKHGYDGPVGSTKPTGKQAKIIPVTFEFRWFVPAEAFRLQGGAFVAIRGDNRGYEQGGGPSRAQLSYAVRIDADHLRVTEVGKPEVKFGDAELYWSSDTTQATDSPSWWRQINAGALPIPGTLTALNDATAMTASHRTASDHIEVTLQLHGKPHFPWKTADFLPDLGIGPLKLRDIVGTMINTQVADVDALARITITKLPNGMLEYTTSGVHDLFGGWELYVNGEPAWLTGGTDVSARATDPRNLWQLIGQTRPINELPRLLREPHK